MQEADKALLKKFLDKSFTSGEYPRIQELLHYPDAQQVMEELTREDWQQRPLSGGLPQSETEQIRHRLFSRIIKAGRGRSFPLAVTMRRYAAMFAGGILIAGISWYLIDHRGNENTQVLAKRMQVVSPGGNKAVLKLADGSTISLSEAANGKIVEQAGVDVRKSAEGELVYAPADHEIAPDTYNSVVTPRGGQYRITLPDGSKVWLNAASSLTYPVQFSKAQRRVQMTGEAYFEIAKVSREDGQGNVPFIVETGEQKIQVLGTHFNVNAYAGEPYIRTTLLEGSVRVSSAVNGESVLLKPGQRALFADRIRVESADTEGELAWKNGDFVFRGENLEDILRELSRWYDVDVECPARLGKLRLNGMISRSKPLSSVIDIIETTHKNKVKITLKGRRLTVTD